MYKRDTATRFLLPNAGDETAGRRGYFSTFPPFLRVLLVTDGTVTRTLEAYFDERIDVQVISHREMASDQSYAGIRVVRGERIIRRKVVLRGRCSRIAYAIAESVIAVERLSGDLQRRLACEPLGIGELIRVSRLETYREVLSVDRARAGEWAGDLAVEESAGVAMRRYVIYIDTKPTMEISEIFPERPFQRRR